MTEPKSAGELLQRVLRLAKEKRVRTPEERAAADAAWRKARMEEHHRAYAEETVSHLKRCGVGEREAELFARGEVEGWQAVDLVRQWMRRTGEESALLVLIGTPGGGKSVAGAVACALGSQMNYYDSDIGTELVTWAGGHARRISAGEMMSDVFGEAAEKRLDYLQRVPLLVVDELGLEHMPANGEPAWRGFFDRLITTRCERLLKTLLLGNLLPADIEGAPATKVLPAKLPRYGGRVARRVRDHGAMHVVLSPQQAARAAGGAR